MIGKDYTVHITYLTEEERVSSTRKASKNDFTNFKTYEEALEEVEKILVTHNINHSLTEYKGLDKSIRLGGLLSTEKSDKEKLVREYAPYCITITVGFLYKTLIDKISTKEISIIYKNHNSISYKNEKTFLKEIKEHLVESYKSELEMAKVLPDNPIALGRVYLPITFGRTFGQDSTIYCWDCGANLRYLLLDEQTLSVINGHSYYDLAEKLGGEIGVNKYDYKFKNINDIPNCTLDRTRVQRKFIKTEIQVPTGDLYFTNFFKKDSLYLFKNNETEDIRLSINCLQGRVELADYYASINVGYGQMGNMSTNVYLKDDGTEIILGEEIYYDEKSEEEIEVEFPGFKNIGSISLSVWRWMCADKTVLDNHKEIYPTKLKPNNKTEKDYKDWVRVKVKPGVWNIEHYYDIPQPSVNAIHSRMYLKI